MELNERVRATLYISVIIFVLTALLKDRLPDKREILKKLYQEPIQVEASVPPFTVKVKGINYSITPIYTYELYGLVVSYHHSKVFWDYEHEDWKDYINTADICVIWGKNIETQIYKKMKFTNGSWTCYPEFAPGYAPETFSDYCDSCLSNNHILAQNESIDREIMSVQKGDQIYMKGYLVNYKHKDWGNSERCSSTTRKDNGCEIVFVKEFKILKKNNYLLRILHNFTKYLIVGCILFFIARFCREISRDN
ncbi:MAG: hypothetical protein PHQ96_00840 [Candidatus Omnitrophica bacterium]|nr:hypothetical protein [Candidatus Omnitrophota bacterium]